MLCNFNLAHGNAAPSDGMCHEIFSGGGGEEEQYHKEIAGEKVLLKANMSDTDSFMSRTSCAKVPARRCAFLLHVTMQRCVSPTIVMCAMSRICIDCAHNGSKALGASQ